MSEAKTQGDKSQKKVVDLYQMATHELDIEEHRKQDEYAQIWIEYARLQA